ncbi:short chain dehydrogenase [bacterium SCSIO 12741]|nr:short chain dehydrogenase [bacterium SCSIO 12741]
MRIAVIGGPGTVGSGIVNLLQQSHEIISIGKTRGDHQVDLLNTQSIEQLFEGLGPIDGIISTIGDGPMAPLLELNAADFQNAFASKVIANFNLIKVAVKSLVPNGFIILTSGIASMNPIPHASTLSVACAGIEAFVRSAALEETGGIRINAVSPAFVKETMELFGMDSSSGISSADTALAYKYLIDNEANGSIINVPEFLAQIKES